MRTVVDLIDHCRQSKRLFFYAGFSPALEVQKSVMFLHFIKVLTNHNRNVTRYIWYQRCSKMTGVMFYDKEYSCLANYGHMYACDNYYTKMYIISHLIK